MRTYDRPSEADGTINTSHFCSTCASVIYIDAPIFPNDKIVKAGIIEDADYLRDCKPQVELFCERRPEWVGEVEGAVQKVGWVGPKKVE